MHEAALARAAQPATAIVLGTRLRPYSLGHELLLSARDFDLSNYEDLETCVLICCQSWREYSAPDFWAGLKARLWKWRTWQWRLRIMQDSLAAEARKFLDYREEGSAEFPLSDLIMPGQSYTGTRWPGAPVLLRLHQFLMTQVGKSEGEAWDYPFGMAKMRWQAFCESEGTLNIYNDHDAVFECYYDEEEAKAAKGGS
jgi:hypothetical protein